MTSKAFRETIGTGHRDWIKGRPPSIDHPIQSSSSSSSSTTTTHRASSIINHSNLSTTPFRVPAPRQSVREPCFAFECSEDSPNRPPEKGGTAIDGRARPKARVFRGQLLQTQRHVPRCSIIKPCKAHTESALLLLLLLLVVRCLVSEDTPDLADLTHPRCRERGLDGIAGGTYTQFIRNLIMQLFSSPILTPTYAILVARIAKTHSRRTTSHGWYLTEEEASASCGAS